MPDSAEPADSISSPEFEAAMRQLASEAAARPTASPRDSAAPSRDNPPPAALVQLIRPLALNLATIEKSVRENGEISRQAEAHAARAAAVKFPELPDFLAWERREEEQSNILRLLLAAAEKSKRQDDIQQRQFDALYEELKGYKELFLFEALQKPIIRDLISLYDDLDKIRGHFDTFLAEATPPTDASETSASPVPEKSIPPESLAFLRSHAQNIENLLSLHIEIFDRLEVSRIETPDEKAPLDKRLQRVMSVKKTANPDEEGQVAAKLRPGFLWRDRVLRPEEVIVLRHHKEPEA